MRLKEIEKRLKEIETELRAASVTAEQLNAFETEINELQEERAALLDAQERRSNLLTQIANSGVVNGPDGQPTPAQVVRSFEGNVDNANADTHNTLEYRRAFMDYVTRGTAMPEEYRTAGTSKTTDVGAVIPTTVLNQIIEKMEAVGMILPLVTRTAYKGGVAIPVNTVKPVATWTAEGTTSSKQKYGDKGTVTFAYHKLRCAVAVSFEVDTMAMPVFEKMLVNAIVTAMTKALEEAIINGNGSGQPKGILKETPAVGQEVETKAPAYADLVAAEGALPTSYENGAVWCMTKTTFNAYAGAVDANGQPVGKVNYGVSGKLERTLLGRKVVLCDYLPTFAAASNTNVVAFLFDFADYVLNTNYAMGIKKYEDNETDDMVTKGIMLADGKTADKNSLVVIKKDAAM